MQIVILLTAVIENVQDGLAILCARHSGTFQSRGLRSSGYAKTSERPIERNEAVQGRLRIQRGPQGGEPRLIRKLSAVSAVSSVNSCDSL